MDEYCRHYWSRTLETTSVESAWTNPESRLLHTRHVAIRCLKYVLQAAGVLESTNRRRNLRLTKRMQTFLGGTNGQLRPVTCGNWGLNTPSQENYAERSNETEKAKRQSEWDERLTEVGLAQRTVTERLFLDSGARQIDRFLSGKATLSDI